MGKSKLRFKLCHRGGAAQILIGGNNMHYKINVSKNGKHYFSTSKNSVQIKEEARKLAKHFRDVFPKREGYEIAITHWETVGEEVDIESS